VLKLDIGFEFGHVGVRFEFEFEVLVLDSRWVGFEMLALGSSVPIGWF